MILQTLTGGETINLAGGDQANVAVIAAQKNVIILSANTTIDASYNGKIIVSSSAITLTFPASLPIGFNCAIVQFSVGQITAAAGAGASMNSNGSFTKTAGIWAIINILCVNTATFVLSGNGA